MHHVHELRVLAGQPGVQGQHGPLGNVGGRALHSKGAKDYQQCDGWAPGKPGIEDGQQSQHRQASVQACMQHFNCAITWRRFCTTWTTVLTAARSALPRICHCGLLMPGSQRRRPDSISTYPERRSGKWGRGVGWMFSCDATRHARRAQTRRASHSSHQQAHRCCGSPSLLGPERLAAWAGRPGSDLFRQPPPASGTHRPVGISKGSLRLLTLEPVYCRASGVNCSNNCPRLTLAVMLRSSPSLPLPRP